MTSVTASGHANVVADNAVLDDLIVACADAAWCKVAVLIARATDAARERTVPVTGQSIAQRIYALVETGRLDAQGNVRRWRAGEVRTPVAPAV